MRWLGADKKNPADADPTQCSADTAVGDDAGAVPRRSRALGGDAEAGSFAVQALAGDADAVPAGGGGAACYDFDSGAYRRSGQSLASTLTWYRDGAALRPCQQRRTRRHSPSAGAGLGRQSRDFGLAAAASSLARVLGIRYGLAAADA